MRILSALSGLAIASLFAASSLAAQFQSGDVYREVVWKPSGKWARVTGADATASGAAAFLPNPVHSVALPDLQNAIRAEVMIEKLSSHSGTRLPKMRLNSNAWIDIPEAQNSVIPGTRGRAGSSWEYLQMTYPVIPVPLAQLRTGSNTFEFACQGSNGIALGKIWPQWLHYGVVFRIYYSGSTAGAPTGAIVSPRSGDVVGEDPDFSAAVSAAAGSTIRRVDFIGDYEDFDWNGDGIEADWKANTRYGVLQQHIGAATANPWTATWDNAWVPTQSKPFRVLARIESSNGLIRISEAITIAMLRKKTVERYRGSNISYHWQTNNQLLHSNNVYVTGDLTKADAARFVVATWNAQALDQLRLNGQILRGGFGGTYDTSYDSLPIDLNRVRAGGNIFETIATTPEHGIEVQWPGFEMLVRYDVPETPALFVPYGEGCVGSNGIPTLSAQGQSKLGASFRAKLMNARASSAAIVLNGFSKDAWSGFPLPFDWAPLGAPNCLLQTSVEFTFGVATDASGAAFLDYSFPNRTEFLGASLFTQFGVFDNSANSLGLTFSNGGRWIFGK